MAWLVLISDGYQSIAENSYLKGYKSGFYT